MDVSFSLLGPLQAFRAGVPLHLGGRQQRAVLARLLLDAGRVVSVDSLADALWGDRTPRGAVATIHTYVSRLRDLLEQDRDGGGPAEVLVTERGGYQLRTDRIDMDSLVFENRARRGRALLAEGRPADASVELTAALGMWRGQALADLTDYEFVRVAASRWDELRLEAFEDRVQADLMLGRHAELGPPLDEMIRANPLRERLHGQRMLVRYRNGNQSEALNGYHELRRTLADEMGIDPSPPLQALYAAILAQADDLTWRPPPDAPEHRPTPEDPSAPERHPRGRRRRSRVAALAAAGSLVAVLVTVLVTNRQQATTAVPLSAFPANSVGRLDERGGMREAVLVGQGPAGVAYGAGSIWVANTGDDTVWRVDPGTGQVVQRIAVGSSPTAVTVTGSDVWVANAGDGTVSRVNALSETETDVIPVGNQPVAIAGGEAGVWVANGGDDTVQRVDTPTGRAESPIGVGGYPDGIAVEDDRLWVSNGHDGTVSPVDVASRTLESPIMVGAGPRGLALTTDALWVANQLDQTVTRIDRSTGRVVATVPVGDGPGTVVAAGDAVWVGNEFDGTVSRIDVATSRVTHSTATGSSPHGLAVAGSSPWVASGALPGDAHRGGTLDVEYGAWIGGLVIDFQYSYDQPTLALLYDGLVAQRRTGGADGLTLVPDLATTLPRPTDGGRIYSFTLRHGIHYSNGEEVRPEDLRRGLARALQGPTASYFVGIVGARSCMADPAHCLLARGVTTDDATSRVVVHLKAPDPEFLYKLSAFVYAVPPGVPIGRSRTPIPTTGPYMVDGYREGTHRLRLVRNPYFQQWSFAARPDGYPDVITWKRVRDPDRRVADVLAGHADLMDFLSGGLSRRAIRTLAREHPTLLHSNFGLAQLHLWLDTRTAPFDDPRVRRALNYAVDRRRLARLLGGSAVMSPTCQFLPPGFAGYRRACPYTRGADDAAYHGPDLATARRLLGVTHATRAPITFQGDVDNPVDRYYLGLLRGLGFRVSMRSDDVLMRSDERAQVSSGYWGPDFAAPSNFWAPVLSCASVRPVGEDSANPGGYCDPGTDALAQRALRLETSDPLRARRVWTEVDRRLTHDAPWVFALTARKAALVSTRVGNYQANPVVGPLVDQMWVQ